MVAANFQRGSAKFRGGEQNLSTSFDPNSETRNLYFQGLCTLKYCALWTNNREEPLPSYLACELLRGIWLVGNRMLSMLDLWTDLMVLIMAKWNFHVQRQPTSERETEGKGYCLHAHLVSFLQEGSSHPLLERGCWTGWTTDMAQFFLCF